MKLDWNKIWKEYDRFLIGYISIGGDLGSITLRNKLAEIVEQHLKDWKH